MQKGRKTRLTRNRIDQLNRLKFVWEAQRGGPRRSKRATVCVPEKPKPVKDKGGDALRALGEVTAKAAPLPASAVHRPPSHHEYRSAAPASAGSYHAPQPATRLVTAPHARGLPERATSGQAQAAEDARRTAAAALLAQASERARRLSHNSASSAPGLNPGASLAADLHAAGFSAAELRAAGVPLNPSGGRATTLGLPAESSDAGVAAAMARLGTLRPNTDLQQALSQLRGGLLDPIGPAQGNTWQVLPHGGFQHQSQSIIAKLGIFPIATPLPIVASGYQLGMIPSSLVQGAAVLPAAPVAQAPAGRSGRKRRKKHKKRKKKSRRREREHDEQSGEGDSTSDSSSSSGSSESEDESED